MAAVLSSHGCYSVENILMLCGVPEEKVKLSDGESTSFSRIPTLTFTSGQSVTGFRTVAMYLATVAKDNGVNLLGNSPLEKAEIDQWFEFCQRQVDQSLDDRSAMKAVLGEMDKHLMSRVYFVGSHPSIADAALYYSLHPYMSELTCQEKEQHVNVSRWFNQVQNLPGMRQDLLEVQFYRNMFYS